MRFMQPIISLNQITGGTLDYGKVPFNRVFYGHFVDHCLITTVLSTYTPLANVSVVGALAVGDRIFVYARVKFAKGATPGISAGKVYQSAGIGTVVVDDGSTTMEAIESSHGANVNWGASLFGIWRCTAPGTVTMALEALSLGSNGTAQAYECNIEAYVFNQT